MRSLLNARYGFLWVTLFFFIISVIGHWIFAWYAYVNEQYLHGVSIDSGDFIVEVSRDTLENWQSEFLQLIWQVAGLAYLLYLGSPQSKEGDERKEAKLDAILHILDEKADSTIASLDKKYPKA